ncbi:response regulator [Vibrio penaeicida]|uniref:DNA-binding response regulator n=1 Tax=Vibrio penaeicida TaxID=104609 RepID=A0AAV5NNM2_9VIBR|nr:response regulator [Vibrio penaeicida]RTZ18854.1 response regulator [Vibrio penaeicida]GLQ71843.1 DNA-binding response regulator [Vibrio penaeicida]
MQIKTHILVVDDDSEIRELLEEYLSKAGFQVSSVEDGEAMAEFLQQQGYPDLILLDVMLPGDDGFTLCQKVRKQSNVPIIMLTAVSDETDQIIGLEIGADDYIAKPFSPRQLMARIKALLRRMHVQEDEASALPSLSRNIVFGDWRLDTLSHRATHSDTHETIEFSGSDFALLMLFLSHPNEILDRDTISIATRGREALPMERGIDVQLSRLRQRLGDKGNKYIKTMRGNGYMFTATVTYER